MISVVIPTFNRPRQLGECLAALGRSRLSPESFEVIVVDDGGEADLDPIVATHRDRMEVTLRRQVNRGPAAARNTGAELARGTLLAFTDDDCLPDPGWLPALSDAAARYPDHLIGGATVNVLERNPFSATSQHIVSYLYEYSERRAGNGRWRPFFTSNNLAVPASGFRTLGGFDTSFPLAAGEDRDFCDRWESAGLPMAYAPEAGVRHAHPLSMAGFWRQHWNYGRGALHFHRARAGRGAPAFRPEPPSFYANLLIYPFRRDPWNRAAVRSALIAVSQCANVLGYFSEKRRGMRPAEEPAPPAIRS